MDTHPEFGAAQAKTRTAGVKVLCITCDVKPDSLAVTEYIEVVTICNN